METFSIKYLLFEAIQTSSVEGNLTGDVATKTFFRGAAFQGHLQPEMKCQSDIAQLDFFQLTLKVIPVMLSHTQNDKIIKSLL